MSLEPFFEKYCTNTSNGKIIEYSQFSDDDDPNYDIIEFKALFPDEDSDEQDDDEDDGDNNENQDNPNENNDDDDKSNTRKSDKDDDDNEDEDEQPKKRGKPNRSEATSLHWLCHRRLKKENKTLSNHKRPKR